MTLPWDDIALKNTAPKNAGLTYEKQGGTSILAPLWQRDIPDQPGTISDRVGQLDARGGRRFFRWRRWP